MKMEIPGGINHSLPRGLESPSPSSSPPSPSLSPPSLTLCCKRLRPLAPKPLAASHLKHFIITTAGNHTPPPPTQSAAHLVEVQSGAGTRWNPTQEQISILETLYKGGMRTPTALQIEHIAAQLNKYGKVEGKNVFYWFQNHKARERQKQKRMTLALIPQTPKTPPYSPCPTPQEVDWGIERNRGTKRKILDWEFDNEEDKMCDAAGERVEERTLNLFPLHPELSLRGF